METICVADFGRNPLCAPMVSVIRKLGSTDPRQAAQVLDNFNVLMVCVCVCVCVCVYIYIYIYIYYMCVCVCACVTGILLLLRTRARFPSSICCRPQPPFVLTARQVVRDDATNEVQFCAALLFGVSPTAENGCNIYQLCSYDEDPARRFTY
jgi:hypothetical protein